MLIPKNLYYTKNHLWLRKIGSYDFCVGITDFAQKEIGEIGLIEFNLKRDIIEKESSWGVLYGINKTFALLSPCECKIISVNTFLHKKPSHINTDPYNYWFLTISTSASENEFLTREEYVQLIR
ncbi:glycine cleavage system protein H [Flavobacterium sp. B17]|uniref:glycine cleavage system protein H n=1 Tax=Flavobacterium sp. B17 TaxID=95618 RepID=UPI0003499B23|nr:glycine cleavage system protein H [Flavobacterium sp. B17]